MRLLFFSVPGNKPQKRRPHSPTLRNFASAAIMTTFLALIRFGVATLFFTVVYMPSYQPDRYSVLWHNPSWRLCELLALTVLVIVWLFQTWIEASELGA